MGNIKITIGCGYHSERKNQLDTTIHSDKATPFMKCVTCNKFENYLFSKLSVYSFRLFLLSIADC